MTSKTYQPMPTEKPSQEPPPTPTPERTRRRTFVQPTFSRLFCIGILALGIVAAQAQSTPTQPNTPPPPKPTTPTTPQTPQQPKPQADKGWVMFDERVGADLGVDDPTLARLREVDARHKKNYDALGPDPTANKDYRILSDRRSADVKGILTADQYSKWNRQYNVMPATPTPAPSTPKATPPDK